MPNGKVRLSQAEFCEQARKLCLLGALDRDLAENFGVSERTLYRWKREDPVFAAAIKAGKAYADGEVAEALHSRAVRGDMTAIGFWLRNRRPDLWVDRRGAAAADGPERDAPVPVRELAKAVALILKRGLDAPE